jgi:hypothetical protein
VRALGEQTHGFGQLERRHGVRALAREVERRAARDQQLQPRGARAEPRDGGRRGEHLLEVVEDEQQLLVAQVAVERLEDRLPRLLAQADRPRDRRRDQLPVAHGRERDEEDAVRELLDDVGSELQREPRLPGAARARERQRPQAVRQQRRRLLELALTADQLVRLHGQVGRAVVERLQRRELRRQPVDLELVEPLGLREILQPVLPEVAQARPVVEEDPRRLGEQHLAAVPRGHHARGVVDVEPDVATVHEPRLAGVQAHADAQLLVARPRVLCERALGRLRPGGGVARRGEGDEERVALAVDDHAVVPLEGARQQPPVLAEQIGVGVADAPEQARRALDVGEEQRDRAGRKLGHGPANYRRCDG